MSVSVVFCPNDEPSKKGVARTRFYVSPDNTFEQLRRDAAHFFSTDLELTLLKDESGALWPEKREVLREVRNPDDPIRVVTLEPAVRSTKQKHQNQPSAPPEHMRLDWHRKPKRKELLLSIICFLLLSIDVFIVRSTTNPYVMGTMAQNTFVSRRSGVSRSTFMEIADMRDYKAWWDDVFLFSLFPGLKGFEDYSGSTNIVGRLVGGVEITREMQVMSGEQAYLTLTLHEEQALLAHPNVSSIRDVMVMAAERPLHEEKFLLEPLPGQDMLDLVLSPNTPPRPRVTVGAFNAMSNFIIDEWTQINPSWCAPCVANTNSLQIRFTLFNANLDMYVFANLKVEQSIGGILLPTYRLLVFEMDPPWGGIPTASGNDWRRLAVLNLMLYYVVVLVHTRGMIYLAGKVKKVHGSYLPFFASTWTWLEILLDALNYGGLGMRITYSYLPIRRDWQPETVDKFVDLHGVAHHFQMIILTQVAAVFSLAVAPLPPHCDAHIPSDPSVTLSALKILPGVHDSPHMPPVRPLLRAHAG